MYQSNIKAMVNKVNGVVRMKESIGKVVSYQGGDCFIEACTLSMQYSMDLFPRPVDVDAFPRSVPDLKRALAYHLK